MSLEFKLTLLLIAFAVVAMLDAPPLQCVGHGLIDEVIHWAGPDGHYIEVLCTDGTSRVHPK